MSTDSRLSPLEQFLRLFTEVRPGEGLTAVLMALNIFLILTAYYILKPVREALILGEYSPEMKSYVSSAMVVVLVFALKAYSALTDRFARRRLINIVTAFFAGCLVLFYVLAQAAVPLGMVFFIWIGIFNVMIVAQFWSFANDVYTENEGKRLFPIVGFGASLGAVLGAGIAGLLIAPLGVYQLMLVGAVLLVIQVLITNYIDTKERQRTESHLPEELSTATLTASSAFRVEDIQKALREYERREREGESDGSAGAPGAGEAGADPEATGPDHKAGQGRLETGGHGAFRLVFRVRYLLLIGILMMLANWVNTTGEYILSSVVTEAANQAVATGQAAGLSVEQVIGEFYSQFYAVVNVAGVLIQLFLVSRIVKYLGVPIAILILPLTSLGAYTVLAFYPVLSYVRWAKTAENATDYSLNNTVRNMLFLPCTREQKYKAKQVVDSFFVRAGDVLSGVVVFVGTSLLMWTANGFAIFNIVLVAIWLVVAFTIGHEYRRLVATGLPPG
jgi:AAA family ATP:ADP antiporter